MRSSLDKSKLLTFMEEVGKRSQSSGRVYLVGGSTALLLGLRNQTIDIDLKLFPEPKGIFEAISHLKEQLSLNVELASPDQFIPPLPGWESRSEFIGTYGEVQFYHYDFYSQVLAKIKRGYEQDILDARALVKLGKVDLDQLRTYFETIEPDLIRYPSINPDNFKAQVEAFIYDSES